MLDSILESVNHSVMSKPNDKREHWSLLVTLRGLTSAHRPLTPAGPAPLTLRHSFHFFGLRTSVHASPTAGRTGLRSQHTASQEIAVTKNHRLLPQHGAPRFSKPLDA